MRHSFQSGWRLARPIQSFDPEILMQKLVIVVTERRRHLGVELVSVRPPTSQVMMIS
jgi:hypothetical protein